MKLDKLEDAIAAVRDDEAPAAVAEAAAARVWQRLEPHTEAPPVEAIHGCADVLALLPAYRRGELKPARALLVEDHLRECAACRAAFREPGGRRLSILPWRAAGPQAKPEPRRAGGYAVAASVLLAVGLSAWGVRQSFFAVPPGSRASLQSVSGTLHPSAAGARSRSCRAKSWAKATPSARRAGRGPCCGCATARASR